VKAPYSGIVTSAIIFAAIVCAAFAVCSCGKKPAEVVRVLDGISSELDSQLKLDLMNSGEITVFPPVKSFEYFGEKYLFSKDTKRKIGGTLTWVNGSSVFEIKYITPRGRTRTIVYKFSMNPPVIIGNPAPSRPELHVFGNELVINKTTEAEVGKLLGKPDRIVLGKPGGPWNIKNSRDYYDPRDDGSWIFLGFDDTGVLVVASISYNFVRPH
jgi:hypothetical protein